MQLVEVGKHFTKFVKFASNFKSNFKNNLTKFIEFVNKFAKFVGLETIFMKLVEATNNFTKFIGLTNNFWKVFKTHKNFTKLVDWKVKFNFPYLNFTHL